MTNEYNYNEIEKYLEEEKKIPLADREMNIYKLKKELSDKLLSIYKHIFLKLKKFHPYCFMITSQIKCLKLLLT